MTTMAIVGGKGSGKTLLATAIASEDDRRVLSNYTLKIPNYSPVEPEDLYGITEPTLVILDEAYTWLESRVSGALLNRYLSYILFQSRKRQIDFILTAQLFETVDKRFRGQTDIYVETAPTVYAFVYKFIAPGRKPMTVALPRHSAEKYFPLYDTMEVVDPMDDEMLGTIADPDMFERAADKLIDEMLSICPAQGWTKEAVMAFVREKKEYATTGKVLWGRISMLKTVEKGKLLKGESGESSPTKAAMKAPKPRKVIR